MNIKQIKKEWEKLKYEVFKNKPPLDSPYPPDIVKQREFLLLAQIHLSNILDAKSRKDKWDEKFETDMYNKVMKTYYK